MEEFTMMRPEEALNATRNQWKRVLSAIAECVEAYDGSDMSVRCDGNDVVWPNAQGQLFIQAICAKFGWVVDFEQDLRNEQWLRIRERTRPVNILAQPPNGIDADRE